MKTETKKRSSSKKPSSKRKGNLNTETRTFNRPRKDVPRGREH